MARRRASGSGPAQRIAGRLELVGDIVRTSTGAVVGPGALRAGCQIGAAQIAAGRVTRDSGCSDVPAESVLLEGSTD